MTKYIFDHFYINNEEHQALEKHFKDLCQYAAWQLIKKNTKNSHTDDVFDIIQELKFATVVAGAYYKRQTYIEKSFEAIENNLDDEYLKLAFNELKFLWKNKTRHGANRQKFGEYQEKLLDRLILKHVPLEDRPNKKESLIIDSKFKTYCKQITWNRQKNLGKKISKERLIRKGLTSLSEFNYLAEDYASDINSYEDG